jgi:hypothetical protein
MAAIMGSDQHPAQLTTMRWDWWRLAYKLLDKMWMKAYKLLDKMWMKAYKLHKPDWMQLDKFRRVLSKLICIYSCSSSCSDPSLHLLIFLGI